MATVTREVLQELCLRHGHLTPELVVAEATPKNHPLHGQFEWDNKQAGAKYRREQAHQLIQSVRLTTANTEGEAISVRKYHATVSEETGNYIYQPIETIIQDEELSGQLEMNMRQDLSRMKERYGHFVDFKRIARVELGLAETA
jgi:hypothetical protein